MIEPTTSRLRHEIDSGRTGDKVAAVDPAAAPLGTDDEAAGRPPSPEAVELALRTERRAPKPAKARQPLAAMTIFLVAMLFLIVLFPATLLVLAVMVSAS